MKPRLLIASALLLGCFAAISSAFVTTTPADKNGKYDVDPVHSMVIFKIRHMRVANFYGRFNSVAGAITVDDDLARCRADITIEVASVDTNAKGRDDHLKGADFFDAAKHPHITFKSDSWKKKGKGFEVAGTLSLVGKEKKITANVERIGSGPSLFGDYRSGFEATFTVKRSDFGIRAYIDNGGLGDEVNLVVSIEGILEGSKTR